MVMTDSQRYLCHLYSINNLEDIVVFLDFELIISNSTNRYSRSRNAQATFVEKHSYIIHT